MRRQPVRCLCTPHRRTLFGEGRRGGTTKTPLYTLPRRVGIGGLRVLLECVGLMSRVALSLATVGTSQGVRAVTGSV